MGKYGPDIGPNIGNASRMPGSVGAHNFQRSYYKNAGASDTRVHYEDLYFDSTGGGEVIRARGIANGLLCATGGTINAAHFTGRVAAAKTVSGALNAVRATLEVAGTTPTPGGTLSCLQLDSNIVTGWVEGLNDAYIRVSMTGAGHLTNFLNFDGHAVGTDPDADLLSTHADHASTHLVKCRMNGATVWLLATNSHA
jgi:hypothetical protein